MKGASMKKCALVSLKAGRSNWKGLKTIQIAAVAVYADAAALVSFAVDSAVLCPWFRFPNLADRPSEIHSVIATQRCLLSLSIAVWGWTWEPLAIMGR